MLKFQKVIVAVASAAMVLGTMGVAGAASTTASAVTREQFVYDFAVANGLQPVQAATPDFSDVPSSSPYYGYIEAAFKAGWINGVGGGMFDPTGSLTRDQIAKIEVIALGDQAAAQALATSSTTFTDNSSLPAWARGYVAEAVKLGLVKGYPDGSFKPNQTLTTSDENYFLAQYKATTPAGTLKIAASANDVAVGQAVTLSASGTNATVTYSVNSSNAVVSGSTFIASQPGTYTVTGTAAGNLSATTSITVYGAAAAIKLSASSSSVVANDASTVTLTATVVDANGNKVANFNSAVASYLSLNGYSAAGFTLATGVGQNQPVINGQAQWTVVSGSTAGLVVGFYIGQSGSDLTSLVNDATALSTTNVSTVAQVPTSIKVIAPPKVADNASTAYTVKAEVDDQTGNPMVTGNYAVTFNVSGVGTFAGGSTVAYASTYVGSSTPTDASVQVYTEQGIAGTITVTGSGTGMASGSASSTAMTATAPTQLVVTGPLVTPTTAGSNAILTVTLEDANGIPVNAPTGGVTFTKTASDTLNTAFGGATAIAAGSSTATITAIDTMAETDTVTVSAVGYASGTDAVTFVAGAPSAVVLTPAAPVNVPATNPKTTLSVQITDGHGNSTGAGETVDFYLVSPGVGTATLGGMSSSSTTSQTMTAINGGAAVPWATATANSSGMASIAFTAQPYTNSNTWVIAAYVPAQGGNSAIAASASTEFTVGVTSTVAASISSQTKNTSTGLLVSSVAAGTSVTTTFTVTDSYGTPVSGDTVNLTFANPSGFTSLTVGGSVQTINATGQYSGTTDANGHLAVIYTPTAAGTLKLSAADATSASAPTTTAALGVTSGTTVAGFAVYNGSTLVTWTNGTTVNGWQTVDGVNGTTSLVALTIKPVDQYGNPIVAPANTTVDLADATNASTAYFRTSATSANVTQVTFPAGAAAMTVYYGNTNTSATADEITAEVQVLTSYLMSPSPIASTGTLVSGAAAIPVTLTAKDQAGNAVSGATVYLSFTKATGSLATASVGATALTSTPAAFVANSSGQIVISYSVGTGTLPTSGSDTITAGNTSASPTVTATDSYTY